ncbi:MAG: hypothetical protein DMG31_20645 [Acidobacteria bacterium]|nr:MAG: hypothetical protein DMG31_20645 [Acidobacteriota bacterium]
MKCQFCHEFGSMKIALVQWHERGCPSNPHKHVAEPGPVQAIAPFAPVPSLTWETYIAQDHKPKIEFNPNMAGSASFSHAKYERNVGINTVDQAA